MEGNRGQATCNAPFTITVNQMKVDRDKVQALEDIKDGRMVLEGMVEEQGLIVAEVEGGAEVKDVVEPMDVGRGDVAVQVLLKPLASTTTDITVKSFTKSVSPNVPISARIRDFSVVFYHHFDMIVDQTNLYASQVMDPSQYDKWTKLTAEELWAYFGFM